MTTDEWSAHLTRARLTTAAIRFQHLGLRGHLLAVALLAVRDRQVERP